MNTKGLILLVGENLDENLLIQHRIRKAGVNNPVYSMHELSHARDYLQKIANSLFDPRIPQAMLIGLDARGHVFDFIGWVRTSSPLRKLPIIALGHSTQKSLIFNPIGGSETSFYLAGRDLTEVARLLNNLPPYHAFSGAAFNSTQNRVPLSGAGSIPTFPPILSTARATMARPIPVPS